MPKIIIIHASGYGYLSIPDTPVNRVDLALARDRIRQWESDPRDTQPPPMASCVKRAIKEWRQRNARNL